MEGGYRSGKCFVLFKQLGVGYGYSYIPHPQKSVHCGVCNFLHEVANNEEAADYGESL